MSRLYIDWGTEKDQYLFMCAQFLGSMALTHCNHNNHFMSRCMEATPTDVCSIIPSSTSYQFTTTPNFDDIFKLVRDEVTNSTFICNQFYIFSACFYSFRECDPSNNGSQLPICQEICPLIDKLYDDCINPYVLKWLIDKTENSEVKQFLEFSEGFKCSKKETYVLPNVTFSTGRCSNFSFIRELIPDPGNS